MAKEKTKICEVCGDEFSKPKGYTSFRWLTRRFCSQECRIKWKAQDGSTRKGLGRR